MQPRLRVVILSGKAQVKGEGLPVAVGVGLREVLAKGATGQGPAPDIDRADRIGDRARRTQMIGVDRVGGVHAVLGPKDTHQQVVKIDVFLKRVQGAVVFAQEPALGVVQEAGDAGGGGLLHPFAPAVDEVASGDASGEAGQAAPGVVVELGGVAARLVAGGGVIVGLGRRAGFSWNPRRVGKDRHPWQKTTRGGIPVPRITLR